MSKFVTRFLKDESGATAIEYGLIAALIAVVLVAALTTLGGNLAATFTQISGRLIIANSTAGAPRAARAKRAANFCSRIVRYLCMSISTLGRDLTYV